MASTFFSVGTTKRKKSAFSKENSLHTTIFPITEEFSYLNYATNKKEKVMKSLRTHRLFHRMRWTLKMNKKKNETEFTPYEVFESPSTKSSMNSKFN